MECTGYTPKAVAEIRAYSTHQYVTVAGTHPSVRALVRIADNRKAAVNTLVSFVQTAGFTGVEIDFEGVSKWTATDYAAYKEFLIQLGNALHHQGHKLM